MTTTDTYPVGCVHCQGTFDALQATWCSCLVSETSLVCPSCLHCFCAAPPAYKGRFWSGAPKSLWDRKFQEHHGESELPANPTPEEAIRPLVLVVEDERAIQRVAARVVASLGYGMVLAKDGHEGLEMARRYHPDLVLSDALMPRLDGREMCRQIKADPEIGDTKVVVMTSLYTAIKYKNEAHRAYRVDDYVTKPLAFDALRSVLQKHIEAAAPAAMEARA